MKLSNEKWVELINEKTEEIQEKCITAFKESLLTEYTEIPLQTDVILHQDGKVYTMDHTGNSTDHDVFNGKAKVIYSVTEQNILDDWNDEESEVLGVLEENNDKEDFIRWLESQQVEERKDWRITDIDLKDYLAMSKLKEYAESEYSDLGLKTECEGLIENTIENMLEKAGDEINHKIDTVIWELENYQ